MASSIFHIAAVKTESRLSRSTIFLSENYFLMLKLEAAFISGDCHE